MALRTESLGGWRRSRNDIYLELAELASECGVEEEPFLKM